MKKSENISLTRYIFYGVNALFGVGFVSSLGTIYRNSSDYMFLIAIIGSLLCFGVGVVYAYMSKHLTNAKGGIYSYARTAFGYRTAFFLNWCQYITSPAVLAAETLSVILAFSTLPFYHQYFWLIILLSGLMFVVQSLLLTFGFRSTKIVVIVLTTVSLASVGFYLVSCTGYFTRGFFGNIAAHPSTNNIKPSFQGFITSFFTFFFALGGIEYLASSSDELKNKEGDIIKGLVIVMLILLGGYLAMAVLAKGVLGPNELAQSSANLGSNPLNLYWKVIYGATGGTVIIIIFAVIKIISEQNARLSIGWLAARVIEPMAEDGFMPPSWAKRNKRHQLANAVGWHSIVSGAFIVGLFIPIIIYRNGNQTIAAPFAINTVLEFVQYSGAVIALLCLMHRNKIAGKSYLYALFYPLLVILVSMLILYAYSAISLGIGTNGQPGDPSQWISLGASLVAMLFALPIYFAGKWTGLHERGWKSTKKIIVEENLPYFNRP